MNRWIALAVLLAIVGALALRLPQLDARPLHNDEAVNAVKVTELWQHGRYAYDPDEYHGPTLHYLSLPFLWLSAPKDSDQLTDATLRLVTVAFGAGLILLLLLFADGLGPTAIVWAAVLTAVSPAMVFYSRYFIHEMLLVFFTALTMGAGWRYFQTQFARWAVVAGAGVGLMFATKETFVLPLAAMVVALAFGLRKCRQPFRLQSDLGGGTSAPTAASEGARTATPYLRHAGLALLAAFVVWLVLFSSFFTHFDGLADSIRTYLPWLKRARGQSPHIHPWSFYLERLAWFHPAKSPVWSEGLILALAALGAGVSLFGKKSPLHRFLALYTILLTLLYCVIAYKTPWCLLGFFHGMILLAGVGAEALLQCCRARAWRYLVLLALAGFTIQLAWQSRRANVAFATDRRNPYVYAQTSRNVLDLVERIEGVARVNQAGADTVVKVVAPGSEYWPLPWYLRRLRHIGWYDALPPAPYAPIVVAASGLNARLDEKSGKQWVMAGMFELRPAVFLELYVELELWKKFVATLPREQE